MRSAVDATIALTFTVTASPAGGTPIVNTATIGTSTTPELIMANNSATVTVMSAAAPPPDLSLVKATDAVTVTVGGELGYQFTISNQGGQGASGIQVVDTLPAGLVYKPGSSGTAGDPAITNGGHTLTWNLPASFDLATGATKGFQFSAVASQAEPGVELVNNAVVNVAGDTQTQNNAASSEATLVTETDPVETGTRLYLPLVRR